MFVAWNWQHMLIAAVAIAGAVLLSLPLAFVYLRTKPPHEFDSAVLFSIVFLAATIAGIFVVVQGSIARALSLAGVVSAVRFRSSLRDSNDAVYLLGAIAVGLAAGSNELDVGLVISALLTLTLVLLWKLRLDAGTNAFLRRGHESRHGHHHRDAELPAAVEAPSSPVAVASGAIQEREPQVNAHHGYIVVETEHAERTRLFVETFLDRETKSWRLDGATGDGNGKGDRHRLKHANDVSTLSYRVRFRKSSKPEAVAERLEAVGLSSDFSVRLEADNELVERSA